MFQMPTLAVDFILLFVQLETPQQRRQDRVKRGQCAKFGEEWRRWTIRGLASSIAFHQNGQACGNTSHRNRARRGKYLEESIEGFALSNAC